MIKAIRRCHLNKMPFDRFTGGQFVHATGDLCLLEDGTTVLEYDDCVYEDAENCVYEDEDEEGVSI